MPEIQVLQELCNLAKTSHRSFTTSLSDEEQRLTTEVTERFAVMKQRVSVLLLRIEDL